MSHNTRGRLCLLAVKSKNRSLLSYKIQGPWVKKQINCSWAVNLFLVSRPDRNFSPRVLIKRKLGKLVHNILADIIMIVTIVTVEFRRNLSYNDPESSQWYHNNKVRYNNNNFLGGEQSKCCGFDLTNSSSRRAEGLDPSDEVLVQMSTQRRRWSRWVLHVEDVWRLRYGSGG